MISKLYLVSPSIVQNLGLTLYGAKTYKDRFVGKVPDLYTSIGQPFSEPTQLQYKLQEERLSQLLVHCAENVPYYRKLLKGIDIKDIKPKNLENYLPKITKRDVVNNPFEFISQRSRIKNRLKLSTSGSSGTPLTVYSSREARRINYRFYERVINEYGVTYRSRSTTIAGRLLYIGESKSPARYDHFNHTQYLSAYSVSRKGIKEYIDALNYWKPLFIDSYPSALFDIQKLASQEGLTLEFSPKVIITSSETLSGNVKNSIESYFKAPVIDHYGCTEMTISAFSRGNGYYADPTYSVLEFEEKNDGAYSVITTGLLNFEMPLIRYEIGDLVSTRNPVSPYIFDSVEGRIDDTLVTPEGRRIGRLGPAYKDIKGIEAIQIIQESENEVKVNVVVLENFRDKFDEATLVDNIKRLTSNSFKISVSYPDSIEKGVNGKLKTVVNKFV